MCLTTNSGKTCSNRIVGTIDVIQCVKIYKVLTRGQEIRLSLEVVKDTSEINAAHITRDDHRRSRMRFRPTVSVSRPHTPTRFEFWLPCANKRSVCVRSEDYEFAILLVEAVW